jgi:hypothetical protein
MDVNSLIERLAEEAAPLRPCGHAYQQCVKWLAGFTVYVGALLFFFLPRPDLVTKFASPLFVLEIASLVAMVAAGSLSAALLSFPDLMQKRRLAFAPLLPLAAFVVALATEYVTERPRAPEPGHEMLCTLCITLFSLLPAIWLFHSLRKAATLHAGVAGYIATLCAFGIGSLTLRLSEQTDSIGHLLYFHYVPMLLMSFAGIALGRRLLKW